MKSAIIIASLGLASVLSFGANAAVNQVNAEQAQNLQSMGTVSVSQVGSAPMDMRQELAAKAEKRLSCTNKPSSSYPTTCPRSVGGFFMAAAH